MNTYQMLQHETAHIVGSIAYVALQALLADGNVEAALKGYGVHYDHDTGELHDVPLDSQNAYFTRNVAAASAYAPLVLSGEKAVCDFICHNDLCSKSLSVTDIATGKNYRGSKADMTVALIASYFLFNSISARKQSRINQMLLSPVAQEQFTLNDLFTVDDVVGAIHRASKCALSVELGKGINVIEDSTKYLGERYVANL